MSRMTSDELLDEYPSLRFRLETPEQTEEEETMVDEFPGNSQRRLPAKPPEADKAPEKNIKKVVSGEVIQRKPSMAKRIKSVFLGDTQSVKDYMVLEVFVPAFKDAIVDAVNGGIERVMFGDNVRPGRRGSRYAPGPGNPFNYAGMSNRNAVPGAHFQNDPRQQLSRYARATHSFDEVIFPSRVDAEATLRGMFELMDQFEHVTVSDFLELAGVSGNNYMDHKFGWTDLRGVAPHRTRGGGFVLGLPPTEPID
jgi:hypothetical protein